MDKFLSKEGSLVTIGLQNPKSPGNVGAVLRAANCFEVDGVYYSGNRYNKAKKFHTDTKNASQYIPISCVEHLIEHAPELAKIVCVELVEGATPLNEFIHPTNAYYIFGPEDGNLSQDVIDGADSVVFIPARSSLNLAASVNVVLYDRVSKSNIDIATDELIRISRDTNNKLVI